MVEKNLRKQRMSIIFLFFPHHPMQIQIKNKMVGNAEIYRNTDLVTYILTLDEEESEQ